MCGPLSPSQHAWAHLQDPVDHVEHVLGCELQAANAVEGALKVPLGLPLHHKHEAHMQSCDDTGIQAVTSSVCDVGKFYALGLCKHHTKNANTASLRNIAQKLACLPQANHKGTDTCMWG
jgi:hypothetical protein